MGESNSESKNRKEEKFTSKENVSNIFDKIKPPTSNFKINPMLEWECSNCGKILIKTIDKCPYCSTNKWFLTINEQLKKMHKK